MLSTSVPSAASMLRGDEGQDAVHNAGDRGLLPFSSLHSSASSAMLTSHINRAIAASSVGKASTRVLCRTLLACSVALSAPHSSGAASARATQQSVMTPHLTPLTGPQHTPDGVHVPVYHTCTTLFTHFTSSTSSTRGSGTISILPILPLTLYTFFCWYIPLLITIRSHLDYAQKSIPGNVEHWYTAA